LKKGKWLIEYKRKEGEKKNKGSESERKCKSKEIKEWAK
jgi:hypothetical protein